MAVKVIDASALCALLFSEPDADAVLARIGSANLAAPSLLAFELASVCLKKIRRHPEKRELFLAAFLLYPQMEIDIVDVQLQEAVSLAEQGALTVYDAVYLWLANTLGCELITLDKELVAAIRRT